MFCGQDIITEIKVFLFLAEVSVGGLNGLFYSVFASDTLVSGVSGGFMLFADWKNLFVQFPKRKAPSELLKGSNKTTLGLQKNCCVMLR